MVAKPAPLVVLYFTCDVLWVEITCLDDVDLDLVVAALDLDVSQFFLERFFRLIESTTFSDRAQQTSNNCLIRSTNLLPNQNKGGAAYLLLLLCLLFNLLSALLG